MREPAPVSSGRALLALLYLDVHRLRNQLASLVREPRRLLVWLALLAWLAFAVTAHRHSASPLLPPVLARLLAGVLPQLTLIALGIAALTGVRRAPPLLRSPADGHFLLNSALPPWTVLLWLELGWLVRWVRLWIFLLVAWMVSGAISVGAGSGARDLVTLVVATAMLLGARVLAYALGRRTSSLLARLPGLALAGALAMAPVAARALRGGVGAAAATRPWPAPPGTWILGAARGDAGAMALLFSTALAVNLGGAWLVSDSLPEVYAASTRVFALRRRRRWGGAAAPSEPGGDGPRRAAARPGVGTRRLPVPGGAWTLLWKEWLTLVRARGEPGVMGAVLVGAVVAGAGAAELTRAAPPGAQGAVLGLIAYAAVIANLVGGASLAADIRKPLWWLSAASLRARLSVWTLATALRSGVPLALAGSAAEIVAGRPALALAAWPLASVGTFVLRAATLFTYVLVPAPADMRGPGRVIRLVVVAVLMVPAAAAGAGLAHPLGLPAAVAAAAAVALLEALGLLAAAARMLEGDALAVARSEHGG